MLKLTGWFLLFVALGVMTACYGTSAVVVSFLTLAALLLSISIMVLVTGLNKSSGEAIALAIVAWCAGFPSLSYLFGLGIAELVKALCV